VRGFGLLPGKNPQKNGPERTDKGRFASGNKGRPPGIPTRKTQEIRTFAAQVLLADDPQTYLKNVRQRIMIGDAPHMERFFAEHLWGRPKEHINISLTETHLLAVCSLSDLELSAFLQALEAQQPEQAMKLLPGSHVA
jgi:hypothetical protein